jgi:head-tail adaptor
MIEITEQHQIKLVKRGKTRIFEIKTIEDMRVPNIRIGDFRHRITIQGKVLTPDGEGGFTEVLTDLATMWAKVTSIKAEQRFEFNSIGVEATHRVEIRGPEGKRIITCRELR